MVMQLPNQLIVQLFPEPLRHWWWTPPPVPDFASPADLAALLISYRTRLTEIRREGGRPFEGISEISDSALAPLLTIAYKASFLKEEGRPVRACLYAPPSRRPGDDTGHSPAPSAVAQAFIQFLQQEVEATTNRYLLAGPLSLNDPKHVARFAPTLAAEDAVLVVGEHGCNLVCTGITLLDHTDAENDLLAMPRLWRGVGGLFVHILGPGTLRVSEGHCEYTLCANDVRKVDPVV